MTMSLLVTLGVALAAVNAEPPAVARTGSIGTGPPAGRAPLVWDMRVPERVLLAGPGGRLARRKERRWLLFYGAVSNLNKISTCTSPGYSRRHLRPRGARPTASSSARRGARSSPRSPASLRRLRGGVRPGARRLSRLHGWCTSATRRLVYGKKSGTWYMFFDTQSCGVGGRQDLGPLSVASPSVGDSGWKFRARITELPGRGPFTFPRLFEDPADGRIYLFYEDKQVTIRAAELIGRHGHLPRARQRRRAVLPHGAADCLSVSARTARTGWCRTTSSRARWRA